MPYHVRRLQPSDVDLLRAMSTVFGEAFEDRETFCDRPPSAEYLARLLSGDAFIAMAAFCGEKVVGGLTAYVLPKPEQARNEIYIYDLAVALDHRRQGVATQLIESLLEEARRRSASSVYVQADVEDQPAAALYSKLGARREVLHFELG